MSKRLEVGVALHVIEVVVPKLEGALKGGESRLGHAKDRVRACKIVPRDRSFGLETNEPSVDLQRSGEKPLGGEIIGVNPKRFGVERIALENLGEELQLEVELALLSKPPGGGFGCLASKEGSPGRS